MQDFPKGFLDRLNECRNNMSVSAFSHFIGLNQKTVDLYVKGERKPSVELIVAVCSKCGVSADWLLGLSDIRTPNNSLTATGGSAAAANGSTATVSTGSSSEVDRLLGIIEQLTGVKGSPTPPPAASGSPSATDKNPPADQPPYEPLKPGTWRPQNW